MTKDLKEKAIKIKGKDYVQVKDRILYFNETYPEGSITTELLSKPEEKTVVVKATITVPGATVATIDTIGTHYRTFTAHSQAVVGGQGVNKDAALENAETSAVGRALAMMGIGILDGIASADEMRKAGVTERNDVPFSKDEIID